MKSLKVRSQLVSRRRSRSQKSRLSGRPDRSTASFEASRFPSIDLSAKSKENSFSDASFHGPISPCLLFQFAENRPISTVFNQNFRLTLKFRMMLDRAPSSGLVKPINREIHKRCLAKKKILEKAKEAAHARRAASSAIFWFKIADFKLRELGNLTDYLAAYDLTARLAPELRPRAPYQ